MGKKEDFDDELYDRLGKMYEDVEKDRNDRDAERERVKVKEEEISKLKEEHQKALSEVKLKNVEDSPSTKEEISKQKLLIEDLNRQVLQVKKDLLKSGDERAELNLMKTKLESEKETLDANSKEMGAELETLVSNEDKLKKSVEESKALVEGSDKKMAAMMHDLEHIREEKFLAEANNKREMEKIKNEKNDKEKELKKIKGESKSRDDTFEQLIKEKAEAVRKAEYLKLELEEVKEEVKSNEVSAQDKRRLSSLNSEIEDLRRSNKQLESSNDGKNKIFSALKAEIEQLKTKNKSLQQMEAPDKDKDKKTIDEKLKEIQVLKRDVDKMFAEKSVLKKQLQEVKENDSEKKFALEKANLQKQIKDQERQLKDQEKVLKENDVDKRFALEKAALLKQMKEMEAEKALNETYKKEMLELSGEIRKKCTQYDAEVSKNKTLSEKLEQKEKEKTALQKKLDKTVAMLTKDEDDEDFLKHEDDDVKPKVQTNEDRKSPKLLGGLTLKSTASLLKAGVSSPFTIKPEVKASGTQSPALSRPPKLMSPNIQLNPHVTIGPVPVSSRGRGRGGLSSSATHSARSTPSPQAGRSNPSPNLARSNPSPSQPRSNPSPISIQPRTGPVQANRPSSNPSQPLKTPPPPAYQRTMSSHTATSNQAPPSPTPNHEEPGVETENDIENDLYEGLVEALEEAQNQRSNTEVQCKYEELLKNLLDKMPDNKDQIIRSLNRAFATVFPGTTVGTAKTSTGSAIKAPVAITPRNSTMEEIITPGAAASTGSPSSQLNSQLASLGARGVQVQPFQQVQQQVVVPQQGMVIQQAPQQNRSVAPQQQRMLMAQQQNRAIQQQQQNRVMVAQQQQQLQQQQQQPQYIMTQAVPQQMQQVNLNQQLQQQGYQVFDSTELNFDFL